LETPEVQTLLDDEEESFGESGERDSVDEELDLDEELEVVSLPSSADSLDLFLNEIGRYPLLTAAIAGRRSG
jgi:Sigma-70 factor, region 1.2